jgi:hypothetical protein
MKRFFAIAAATVWLGCGPSFAQTILPGMGTTTPLGVPGTNSPAGPVGIPLGSTGLMPGGLSPGPLGPLGNTTPCVGVASSGTGVSGSTSGSTTTFDGGGVSGMQASSSTATVLANGTSATSGACGGTSPAGGTASGTTASTAGTVAGSAIGSGAIPLDSTEIGNAGISPMTPLTTPSMTSTPCPTVGASPIITPSFSTLPDGTIALVTPNVTSQFGC